MQHRNLDHFVVSALELDLARQTYSRLGFAVMPRMRHAAIGTSNHVVQFHDTYLELIGDMDKCTVESLKRRMLARFEGGEGLSINCLTSSDLMTDRVHLLSLGRDCDPIISARRQVVMPDGRTDETASDCFYVWREDARVWSTLFYSQHNKPQVIWIPQWQVHPNTVQRVLGISYVSNDLAADEPYFTDMFQGAPAERGSQALSWHTPRGETFELLSADGAAKRFGAQAPAPTSLSVVGIGLRYGVTHLAACRRALSEGGVPFAESEGVITVGSEQACGVISEFVALT